MAKSHPVVVVVVAMVARIASAAGVVSVFDHVIVFYYLAVTVFYDLAVDDDDMFNVVTVFDVVFYGG